MRVDEIVTAELVSWNKLLPPRWGDRALRGNEATVSSWFRSLLRRDIEVGPEEVLLARKLGRGARPLTLLGLKERLLFRAAVDAIERIVGRPDRSQSAYEAFRRAPLDSVDCEYVLKADVSAYYQFVDHDRLIDEVVAQTGDDLAVTLAVEVLQSVSGRRFGLPQLSHPSDVLAEIYIDPLRRDLVRAGFNVWRFADDFRIAAPNYGRALAALEATDHGARQLGLVLNELKTSTPKRATYEASLTARRDREGELFADLEVENLEEPELGEYGDGDFFHEHEDVTALLPEGDEDEEEIVDFEEPEAAGAISAAQVMAASKVIDLWLEEEEDEDTQRTEAARVTSTLLRRALLVFARARDTSAVEHATAMLVYEPSLTPTIARYLLESSRAHRREVRDTLDDICRSGVLSEWQSLWIAYVAGELTPREGGHTRSHVQWLGDQLASPAPAVAAEAALALGRRRLITPAELLEVIETSPAMHRPTGLLGLAALGAESAAYGACDSELDRIRVEWAARSL